MRHSQSGSGLTRRSFVESAVRAGVGVTLLSLAPGRIALAAQASLSRPERVKVLMEDIVHWKTEHFARGQTLGVSLLKVSGRGRLLGKSGGEYTSDAAAISFGATHLGLHWITTENGYTGLKVSVRTGTAGVGWSDWQPVEIEVVQPRGGGAVEVFAALVDGGRARRAQYRVEFLADGATLDQMAVTAINSVDGPRETISLAAPSTVTLATPRGSTISVITREGWGCDETRRFSGTTEVWPEMYVPAKKLVLHHTAGGNRYTNGAAEVRAVYAYQAVSLGYGDIGYNVLVDKFGTIYEGRHGRGEDVGSREILSEDVVGGHVLSLNYGTVGVSAVGNYQTARPSAAMLTALQDVFTFECDRHHLQPRSASDFLRTDDQWQTALPNISGHYESAATSCPGTYLISQIAPLRDAVAARLGTSIPPTLKELSSPNLVAPGSLAFSFPDPAPLDYCLEGWQRKAGSEDIDYLSGYASSGRPDDALAMTAVWAPTTGTQMAFTGRPAGHYTMHLRAAGGQYESSITYLIGDHPIRPEIVVDDTSSGFVKTGSGWQESSTGYGGHLWWAYSNGSTASCLGEWQGDLDGGLYEVFAWVPGSNATTRSARYTVLHQDPPTTQTTKTVNQSGYVNQWVSLGTYTFPAGPGARVRLSNATGEKARAKMIAFDALRFVPR